MSQVISINKVIQDKFIKAYAINFGQQVVLLHAASSLHISPVSLQSTRTTATGIGRPRLRVPTTTIFKPAVSIKAPKLARPQ